MPTAPVTIITVWAYSVNLIYSINIRRYNMIPTQLSGNTDDIFGAPMALQPGDLARSLATWRDWDGSAVVITREASAPVVVDMHEWDEPEDDGPAVYYEILTEQGGVWTTVDGGILAYDGHTTLDDLMTYMHDEVERA